MAERCTADILIVDDVPENLRLLHGMLVEASYDVRGVRSGEMALALVQTKPPDLILLDINMPKIDGYEVCRRLKADETSASIPIVFLSALDQPIDKVRRRRRRRARGSIPAEHVSPPAGLRLPVHRPGR